MEELNMLEPPHIGLGVVAMNEQRIGKWYATAERVDRKLQSVADNNSHAASIFIGPTQSVLIVE